MIKCLAVLLISIGLWFPFNTMALLLSTDFEGRTVKNGSYYWLDWYIKAGQWNSRSGQKVEKTLVHTVADLEGMKGLDLDFLYEAKKYKEVVSEGKELLKLSGNNALVHFMVGKALSVMGHYEEAWLHAKEGLKLNPNRTVYQLLSILGAEALHSQGLNEEALVLINQIDYEGIELFQASTMYFIRKAQIYIALDMDDEAEDFLELAEQKYSELTAMVQSGLASATDGTWQPTSDVNQLIPSMGDISEYLTALGYTLGKLGRHGDAISVLDEALSSGSGHYDGQAYIVQGESQYLDGDTDGAEVSFSRAENAGYKPMLNHAVTQLDEKVRDALPITLADLVTTPLDEESEKIDIYFSILQ